MPIRQPCLSTARYWVAIFVALVGVGCAVEPPCPAIDAAVTDTVVSIDTPQGHKVTATLYAPSVPGDYPLVVFSHGAYAAPERYDTLLRHWASAGVVVAALVVGGLMSNLISG